MYTLLYTSVFLKDLQRLRQYPVMLRRLQTLMDKLQENPYAPPCEKIYPLQYNRYSRRLNIQHRLIYEINEETQEVKLLSCWTHYER